MAEVELILSAPKSQGLEISGGFSEKNANSYTKQEVDELLDKKLDAGKETNYISKLEFSGIMGSVENGYFKQLLGITDKSGKVETLPVFYVDLQPKKDSTNPITSGAVYDAIGDIDTALENIIAKYGLGGDVI